MSIGDKSSILTVNEQSHSRQPQPAPAQAAQTRGNYGLFNDARPMMYKPGHEASNIHDAANPNRQVGTNTDMLSPLKPECRKKEAILSEIDAELAKANIKLTEEEKIQLLENITRKSAADIFSKGARIHNIIISIRAAIEDLKANKINTCESDKAIDKISYQANSYYLAITAGKWSIEGLRDANNHRGAKGLNARLGSLKGVKGKTDEEKLKLLIKDVHDHWFHRIFDNDTERLNKQIQTYSRIYFNSTIEERKALKEALKYMDDKNLVNALKILFEGLDVQAQKEVSDSMDPAEITKLAKRAASTLPGNKDTNEVAIATYINSHKSLDGIVDYAKKLNQIEIILKKVANKESLNPEETAIYEELKSNGLSLRDTSKAKAGAVGGAKYSKNLTPEEQVEAVQYTATALCNGDDAREVLELLQKSSEVVEQTFSTQSTISQEDFTNIMDEATNGNYSIVRNDIQNNTHTELNPPRVLDNSNQTNTTNTSDNTDNRTQTVQAEQTAQQTQTIQTQEQDAQSEVKGGLGFALNDSSKPATGTANTSKTTTSANDKAHEDTQTATVTTSSAAVRTSDGFKTLLETEGKANIFVKVFSNISTACDYAKSAMITFFKSQNADNQYRLYQSCNTSGKAECLQHAKDSMVLNITNYTCHAEKLLVEAAKERIEEKNKNADKQNELYTA